MAERKTSRKLSVDLARKISAISVASDVSGISERFVFCEVIYITYKYLCHFLGSNSFKCVFCIGLCLHFRNLYSIQFPFGALCLPSLHFPILKESPGHVFRLGLEQDELKSIMQDILEMDLNNDWEVRTMEAPKNV
jgi:hypothetical protein